MILSSMRENEIDKKLFELLDGVEITPDKDLWRRVNTSLDRAIARKLFQRRLYRVVGSLSSAAAVLVVVIMLFKYSDKNQKLEVNNNKVAKLEISQEKNEKGDNSLQRVADYINTEIKKTKIEPVAEIELNQTLDTDKINTEDTRSQESNFKEAVSQQITSAKQKIEDSRTLPIEEQEYKKKAKRSTISASINLLTTSSTKTVLVFAPGVDYKLDNLSQDVMQRVFDASSTTKHSLPATFGIQFTTDLNKNTSIGTGLIYTYLHSKYSAVFFGEEGDVIVNQHLHYLGIPFNTYYKIINTKKLIVYINAGVLVEKGLGAVYKIESEIAPYSFSEPIKPIAWSVNAGFGMEYIITPKTGLYLDPGFVHYFNNNQPISIRTEEPLQFKFEMGLRFHF